MHQPKPSSSSLPPVSDPLVPPPGQAQSGTASVLPSPPDSTPLSGAQSHIAVPTNYSHLGQGAADSYIPVSLNSAPNLTTAAVSNVKLDRNLDSNFTISTYSSPPLMHIDVHNQQDNVVGSSSPTAHSGNDANTIVFDSGLPRPIRGTEQAPGMDKRSYYPSGAASFRDGADLKVAPPPLPPPEQTSSSTSALTSEPTFHIETFSVSISTGNSFQGQGVIGQMNQLAKLPKAVSQPVSVACTSCRERHLKCDAASPICLRCKDEGRECIYIKSRRGWKTSKQRLKVAAQQRIEQAKAQSASDTHKSSGLMKYPAIHSEEVGSSASLGQSADSEITGEYNYKHLDPSVSRSLLITNPHD
jgi:hypothetical protein